MGELFWDEMIGHGCFIVLNSPMPYNVHKRERLKFCRVREIALKSI